MKKLPENVQQAIAERARCWGVQNVARQQMEEIAWLAIESARPEVEELKAIVRGLLDLGPAEGDGFMWEPLKERALKLLGPQNSTLKGDDA